MPPLAAGFTSDVARWLLLAKSGEAVLAAAPRNAIIRRELRVSRLEALYELAFLRVVLSWETFLEESLQRLLCGYELPQPGHTAWGTPYSLLGPPYRSLAAADLAIRGGRDFVSWAPERVISRSATFLSQGPHEIVLQSAVSQLRWLHDVRNRIAHPSDHARTEFDKASMGLIGRRYRGSSPGRLLRAWDLAATPNVRMIESLSTVFVGLASQISP